jgi:branched-chain amino acid transport system ATP-binding protein
MTAVLKVTNLRRRFGSIVVANDLNVSIARSSVVAVIGTNGAGKTTFVNMLTGYIRPDSGRIRFESSDIVGLPPRSIHRLGISRSFQVAQLFPSMTAIEALTYAFALAEQRGVGLLNSFSTPAREKCCIDLLDSYHIGNYRNALVRTLPQGPRKLLDIAIAMASKPSLLLLDEPTSGISSAEKFPIMDTIITPLRASGVTIVFVEHDMSIVSRYVERVLAFDSGSIIADGSPIEVFDDHEVRARITGGHFPGGSDQGARHA